SIISQKQDEELIEINSKDLYDNEISPLILIYKNIDEIGILVDSEQKQKLFNKYTSLYESNLNVLRNLVGNPIFNPASSQQVGRFIYEDLKFPKRQKTLENGIKSYKTDKETLDDLLINHPEKNRLGELGTKILRRQIVCRKLLKVIEYITTPLHPGNYFKGSS